MAEKPQAKVKIRKMDTEIISFALQQWDHVDGTYDPTFIDVLNRLVSEMRKPA